MATPSFHLFRLEALCSSSTLQYRHRQAIDKACGSIGKCTVNTPASATVILSKWHSSLQIHQTAFHWKEMLKYLLWPENFYIIFLTSLWTPRCLCHPLCPSFPTVPTAATPGDLLSMKQAKSTLSWGLGIYCPPIKPLFSQIKLDGSFPHRLSISHVSLFEAFPKLAIENCIHPPQLSSRSPLLCLFFFTDASDPLAFDIFDYCLSSC